MNTIFADAIRHMDVQAERLARRRAARGFERTQHLREVVEKRTLTSKTYWRGGDSYRLIVGMKPKHVPLDVAAWQRDGTAYTGGWADLDPTWSMVNGRLESGVGWYRVTVDPAAPCAIAYASLLGGSASMRMAGIDLRSVSPLVIPRGLRWTDVAEDFDVELHLYPHGVEWFKRLKSAKAPRAWSWDMEQTPDFAAKVNWHARGWDNWDKAARLGEEMFLRRHRTAQTSMAIRSDDGRRIVVDEAWTGAVIALEPGTRIKTLTDDVVYPVWIDQDITEAIAADADDVQEDANANTVSVLGGTYGNQSKGGGYGFNPGWRWITIAIDQGVTIDLANAKIQCTRASGGGVTAEVFFDAVTNAAAWSDSSRPEQISRTATGGPIDLTTTGLKTVVVTADVQEIVNLAWVSGNAMRAAALDPSGAGVTTSDTGDLTDSAGAVEAVLEIDWTAAGGGSPTRLRRRMLMGIG